MPSVQLLIPFLPGELNMASVLHYHYIALIPFWTVGWLVLSLHIMTPSSCSIAPLSILIQGKTGRKWQANAMHGSYTYLQNLGKLAC